MPKHRRALFPLLLLTALPAAAQPVEEIIITGVRDTSTVRTEDTLVAPPDTADLLRRMPGANVNRNGPLTGIAQYRGMYGNRLGVEVDGAPISSGGPNAMDAPLHYAPVALLESLTIHRGITPVRLGQETLGGNVEARTFRGDFGPDADFHLSSRLYTGVQSVNEGVVASGLFTLANREHLLRASLLREEAGHSDFPGGRQLPSEYRRERIGLGYGWRRGDHEVGLDLVRNNTGNAGTPALPMDIRSVDGDLARLRYAWEGSRTTVNADLSLGDISHWMTNYHLRRPPQGNMMTPGPMLYRRTLAVSDSLGFSIKAETEDRDGTWRYGVDGHYAEHGADIGNPNVPGFHIVNFNQARRDVTGIYVERETVLLDRVGLEGGARFNRVDMDAGTVRAELNPMGMDGMPAMMDNLATGLATRFNQADLDRRDHNLDLFARLDIEFTPGLTGYLGAARKNRSPSYQERYLWLPLESTGGLADGLTYTGNPALSPETAHEVEIGFDWRGDRLNVYPRLFYREVDDYIQGVPARDPEAVAFGEMMSAMGMGRPRSLTYANVDARFHGVDIEADYTLSRELVARAVLSMVRGERTDIDDHLYRIAPDNLLLALDYHGGNWVGTLEGVAYASQERVSATNLEQTSAGYAVFNASARFYPSAGLEIGVGIENLFDRRHREHLAGYNRAWNPDLGTFERMVGAGRNVYARLIWAW